MRENVKMPQNKSLAVGEVIGNFKLAQRINSLDGFWIAINNEKSIFARHRMWPTAFFHSWNIRLIKQWMDRGWFFVAERNENKQ